MTFLDIALIIFVNLETLNLILLYKMPGSTSGIVLVFSILTFDSRLYPALKSMDTARQLDPRGYSLTLAIMI